jgi:hypothetical protein
LMYMAAFGAMVVFWSVYWKVSITLRNFKFLGQKFRRLRWRSFGVI